MKYEHFVRKTDLLFLYREFWDVNWKFYIPYYDRIYIELVGI